MRSPSQPPRVLIVDDNPDLLHFLGRLMSDSEFTIFTAESAQQARRIFTRASPDAALLDYMLQDGNGVELGEQLRKKTQILPLS